MKEIERSELSNLKMVAGNELKYTKIIDDTILKHWVGIGWIDVRKTTKNDYKIYPTIKD